MIQGFEDYTATLTTYERDMLIPILSEGLRKRIGAKNAIRNKEICLRLKSNGYENVSEPRIRKCVNYIRMNGLVPHLVANNRGYYVATSIEEVEKYVESLDERAKAIWAIRSALKDQLTGKLMI